MWGRCITGESLEVTLTLTHPETLTRRSLEISLTLTYVETLTRKSLDHCRTFTWHYACYLSCWAAPCPWAWRTWRNSRENPSITADHHVALYLSSYASCGPLLITDPDAPEYLAITAAHPRGATPVLSPSHASCGASPTAEVSWLLAASPEKSSDPLSDAGQSKVFTKCGIYCGVNIKLFKLFIINFI